MSIIYIWTQKIRNKMIKTIIYLISTVKHDKLECWNNYSISDLFDNCGLSSSSLDSKQRCVSLLCILKGSIYRAALYDCFSVFKLILAVFCFYQKIIFADKTKELIHLCHKDLRVGVNFDWSTVCEKQWKDQCMNISGI